MYIGNVSNFFYQDKEWLTRQPKFSIGANNKNNILKIGKKYYMLNTVTGKLKLVQSNSNNISKNTNCTLRNYSNITEENKKDNKDNLPELTNNSKINQNKFSFFNEVPVELNNRNKSSDNQQKILIYYNTSNGKNKSNENINKKFLLNNSKFDKKDDEKINLNNTDDSIIGKNNTRNTSSIKLNNNSQNNKSIIYKIKNDIIKSKLKFQIKKNEEKNKILSKRNLKKLLERKKKSNEELKTNITNTNYSNNDIQNNKSVSLSNNNNYNNRTNIKNLKLKKLSIFDGGDESFAKCLFPNDKSLGIKQEDSWYLKTIKNQLYKDRIFENLKKQYQFYEDSENKREVFKIPKLNIKNTIKLSRYDIFPPNELLYHKIFFDNIKRQRIAEPKTCETEYPLIET